MQLPDFIYPPIIMLCAVLVNHLGLIEAMEKVIGFKLPIINCCKCLTFWSVLFYISLPDLPKVEGLLTALLMAYGSIWTELLFGLIDLAYDQIYRKFFTGQQAEDCKDELHPEGKLPKMQQD